MEAAIAIMPDRSNGDVHPFLYGQFIEHLERCIQPGIYDEHSPLSDRNGFRRDVLDKARGLNPPMLRWPGGTFSKIYHWTDGIGPKQHRPRKRNLIWGGVEDNHFGTDEFMMYCRELGAEPFITVNMAGGTAEEAANWVEYCNGTGDTHYANLRRSHGFHEPHNVKYWGLGNEEYGLEDVGALHDPRKYVEAAWEFVKWMKLTDPSIEFVAVGESRFSTDWNRYVLQQLGPVCDYFSLHFYASSDVASYGDVFRQIDNLERLLAQAEQLLDELPARVERFPKWYRFPPRQHPVRLAIDEWNIWDMRYGSPGDPYGFAVAYSWRDALWVASVLNRFHTHARSIGMAQLAQMVNVLAPIATNETGSIAQTIYYPLALYREHCGSRSLPADVQCPEVNVESGEQPIASLDVSATYDAASATVTLMVVNRDPEHAIRAGVVIRLPSGDVRPSRPFRIVEMNAPSWQSTHTFGHAGEVRVRDVPPDAFGSDAHYEFPRHSITMLKFLYG